MDQICRNRPFSKIQTIATDLTISIDFAIRNAFLLADYSITS